MVHLLALAFYALLSLVFLRNLLPVWSSAIPGGLEDTRLFLWNAWWFRHAIHTLHQSPFSTTLLFHPFGTSLISHDFPLWTNLVTYIAQTCGCGVVAASNVWFILSWILAGFFSYLLVWEVVQVRAAALVAGLYVMTHSYTLARAMQNWGQFNLWGIALFLWLVIRAKRKGGYGHYVFAGVALAWTAACHYYFLIYCGTIALLTAFTYVWPCRVAFTCVRGFKKAFLIPAAIAFVLAAYILICDPGNLTLGGKTIGMQTPSNALLVMWLMLAGYVASAFKLRIDILPLDPLKRQKRLAYFGTLFVTALACLSPLIIGTVRLISQGGYPKQTILWKTHPPGANLLALLSPNPIHALWGEALSSWYDSFGMNAQEQAAGIGWTCLAIVILSQIWKRRQAMAQFLSPETPDLGTRNWLFLAVLSTVMAMGTYLHILWVNLWLPLPFYIWRLLPVLGNVRIPERWMAVGAIAWAVVLGLALVALARKKNWPMNKVCLFAGLLILLENWPGIPVGYPAPRSPIYETLKQQPAGGVLPLPLYIGDSSIGAGDAPPGLVWDYLGYQMQHQHPIVGGYVGRIQRKLITQYKADPVLGQIIDLEEGKPISGAISDAQACDSLKKFQISYVLLYPDALTPAAGVYVQNTLSLQLIQKEPDVALYAVSCPQ